MNYWEECIRTAAEECGLSITDEQAACLAGAAEGCHENYSLAYPSSCVTWRDRENDRLKRELQAEKDKRVCEKCHGTGRIADHDFDCGRSSNSPCWECHGAGRL